MLDHEYHKHEKAVPSSAYSVLQKKMSDSSKTETLRDRSTSGNGSDKQHAAESSPAGSVSLQSEPPSENNSKCPDSCDGSSDSQKYATRVTICADGKELISREQCYSGDLVFPRVPDGKKSQCPICNVAFFRNDTMRNHVALVHNIIRAGETVYSCVPCKFETTRRYLFVNHQSSQIHCSNLARCCGSNDSKTPKLQGHVNDNKIPKPQSHASLTASYSQRLGWLYNGVPSPSYQLKVGAIERRPTKLVWYGHAKHVCSSQCLSGLNSEQSSADDVSDQTIQPRKSLDAPAPKIATATSSVNTSKEMPRLRSSSDTSAKKRPTARKSTTQPMKVAFNFLDKKKQSTPSRREHSMSETAKLPLAGSVHSKTGSAEEAITVSDSNSEIEEVESSQNSQKRVTQPIAQLSNVSKKGTSGVTKPGVSLTTKRKENLSVKSVNIGSSAIAETQKSAGTVGNQRSESVPARCSGSRGNPSLDSISHSQTNFCQSTTSPAIKMPLCVTKVQPVPVTNSGNISVSSPVSADETFLVVTSSAPVRSVPVIGVAKAVPAATTLPAATVLQTVTTSGRSLYSLHRFSAETLWSELSRRGGLRTCDCGVSYMESALYLLHRSCHSDLAPLKCSFCDHKAATNYDFHAHLLDHKK